MRVPEDKNLVVLLNNTGGTNLGAMFEGIADILYGRTPPPPKPGIATVLYETMRRSGAAAAVAEYADIRAKRPSAFDMREGQLLRLGRELLEEKRSADAIEVFKLAPRCSLSAATRTKAWPRRTGRRGTSRARSSPTRGRSS
jgi:hypothetical protein